MFTFFCFSAFAEDEILIASIFAKSGDAASSNWNHLEGVRYAVDEVNKNGGILGKKVKLLEFDNFSTPIQSKIAAKQAVRAKVVGVIGASWSSHSLAMAPTFQRAKIPMISPDSTNEKVTEAGDYIFRATFIDPVQGKVLANFAMGELKAKTALIITNVTSSYSIGLSEVFRNQYEKLGGKVVGEFEFKKVDSNFKPLAAKAKNLNPELIIITGHDESGIIVKYLTDEKVGSYMIGGDGWAYREFFSNGGQDLKEGYYTTHWAKDLDREKSKEFIKEYAKDFEVSPFAVLGYDAAMLLFDAIKRAGSTNTTAIKDALAKTDNYQGVSGDISFDEKGNPIKNVIIMKIENGKTSFYKSVKP